MTGESLECAVCGVALPSPMSFAGHFSHRHRGMPDPGRKARESTRFWRLVSVLGEDECWTWNGFTNRNGYGEFRSASGVVFAHRFALAESLGRPLGSGLKAIHSCDNPPCVNPRHLREGTPRDNTADMMTRGRNRYETRRGEQSTSARLSESDVRRIRSLVAEGESLSACARMYGVSLNAVSELVNRKSWRHVA